MYMYRHLTIPLLGILVAKPKNFLAINLLFSVLKTKLSQNGTSRVRKMASLINLIEIVGNKFYQSVSDLWKLHENVLATDVR